MRVLVVDDDRLARAMMADALRDEGHEVAEAEDVAVARPQLAGCDVALIDMVLPDEPGLALLGDAVRLGRAAVMVTGGVSTGDAIAAMRAGAYDVLQKPFHRDLLVRAVGRAVERIELARENRRLLARLEGRAHDLEEERAGLTAELERRAEAIARAKDEWERTFDAMPDGIAVVDRERRVIRANPAFGAGRMVGGGAPGAGAGVLCHETMFGSPTRCEGCPLDGAAGAPAELARGGRVFRVHAAPLSAGRGTHVVVHRDVTAERELSHRLARTERLAAVGRLAAGVAHEINNPLSYVAANVRAAQAVLTQPEAAAAPAATSLALGDALDALRDAEAGAERVATIVRALKVIAGDRPTDLVAVRLDDSLDRALEGARRAVGPSGAQVEVAWGSRAAGAVLADPLQLDRACLELLKNAFEATPRGGCVSLRTYEDRDRIVAEIADQGRGIPPEIHPRVGEPFFTSGGVGSGRGLGLAVAFGIVRIMGGELTLASDVERGARVLVSLPRAPAGRTLVT